MPERIVSFWRWCAEHWKLWGIPTLVVGAGTFLMWIFNFRKTRAEAQLAEYRLKVEVAESNTLSDQSPRIVPSYVGGRNSTSPTDDELILTNLGGGDALDVQVGTIETGLTTIWFAQVPIIPSKQAEAVSPNLSGVAYGREIKIPFHDLAAYCEEAAQRGLSSWSCRITYRDFNGNWFETTFALKHSRRYEVETEDFVFSRLASAPVRESPSN